ncbi:MAG: PEP/pyruvate-binding domain-containing protein [Burkholderiales bacterium]
MSAAAEARTLHAIGLALAGAVPGGAALTGFKAESLARMAGAGLPVPPGFVLGTGWSAFLQADPAGAPPRMREALADGMRALEAACGLSFAGERRPLLVSVRSGAPTSMPGMMDTILNIGLCDRTARGLLRLTGNPRLVWDCYRRLVQQYACVVKGARAAPFHELAAESAARAGVAGPRELDFENLAALAQASLVLFEDLTGEAFPQDPREQLEQATLAVFRSWNSPRAVEYRRLNAIAADGGTAVTIQRMVYGNAGGTSGSGVGFTRDPATGEDRLYLDFLFNAQGEDVVSGRHAVTGTARLPQALPEVAQRLEEARGALESLFGDAQEFEFTVQDGRLYLLQSRSAKRTPWAALRIAVEQVAAGIATPAQALARLEGIDLERIERRRLEVDGAEVLATASSASIGMAAGAIALDRKACERLAGKGRRVILVRGEANTDDVACIALATGLLTARGGRTSHAAVVARQLGKVCLVGCEALSIDLEARRVRLGSRTLKEGETICLDADNGRVFAGEPRSVVERPLAALAQAAKWRADAA